MTKYISTVVLTLLSLSLERAAAQSLLPGTAPLTMQGDLAAQMVDGINTYLLDQTKQAAAINEWVWKTTSIESHYSYMLSQEYDMLEFDFADVVNYSDLANLMAPRPFMAERGHNDGVAPDEWVAYEYAKTRRFYDTKMHMPERTAIEFFDGPHMIHGVGTFEFLHRWLRWPQ